MVSLYDLTATALFMLQKNEECNGWQTILLVLIFHYRNFKMFCCWFHVACLSYVLCQTYINLKCKHDFVKTWKQ